MPIPHHLVVFPVSIAISACLAFVLAQDPRSDDAIDMRDRRESSVVADVSETEPRTHSGSGGEVEAE